MHSYRESNPVGDSDHDDWWLNYPAVGGHQLDAVEYGGLYIASLNHTIWLHHRLRADEWLHFESTNPTAASGRGLSIARVHDRSGQLVASCAQECVMAPRAWRGLAQGNSGGSI